MKKEFNIIITGVGGQGLITLLRILAESAFLEGFDVKTSEIHGLSQREGSVSTHIRFGKKIYSPLIRKGRADLILSLEMCEALRSVDFANKNTIFLVNQKFIPYINGPTEKKVLQMIKKMPDRHYLIEASKICQEKLKKEILAGIYLLGFAVAQELIPLKPGVVLKAMKKIIPQEFFGLNTKAFQLGQKHEEG